MTALPNIQLEDVTWQLSGVSNAVLFFKHAGLLLGADAILVLEEDSMDNDVRRRIATFEITPRYSLHRGTLWPTSRMHHLTASPHALAVLSQLVSEYAEPEVCDHIYAYRGSEVFLKWHDAFGSDLLLSSSVDIELVEQFCQATGSAVMPD